MIRSWIGQLAGFVLSVLLVSILLAGCSASEETGPQAQSEELILALGAEPEEGFDPTTGWGRYGSPLFQSTLLKRDHELKLEYDLAKSYSVSEDGLTWTVMLRDGVLFSDGTPLTAEDVVFTFKTAARQASTVDLTVLSQVEAPDAQTVRFHLKQPQSTFVSHLVQLGIVPKHVYGKGYAQRPVGSGPYQFVQWDRGQQLIVEVNKHYYGEKPFFKKLTFLFLGEDAAFAAAKSGQVDVAAIPTTFSRQAVDGMRLEAIPSVDNRGIMFPYVEPAVVTDEGFSIGNAVTSDRSIRLAVNVALDRAALVDGILEGYGTPAYTVNDGLPWWNPDTMMEDGDVEAAIRILRDGGWKDLDGDGVVEKDGQPAVFTLLYPAGDVTRQSLALASADMVKEAGISIDVEGASWDEIEQRMHKDAVVFGWGSHDPLEMLYVYGSDYQGVEYFNPGYYSNPTVDRYMTLALAARSEEEALVYWQKSQWDGTTGLSARGDAPWAWLVNMDHLYLVREDLDIGRQGTQPHGHGWPITDPIAEWAWSTDAE